jgi:hypothetical protein
VATEAQLGRLPIATTHELRLRIGAAFVRVVPAPLAPEVDHAGTITAGLRRTATLPPQALQARPRLDQRRDHREVLGRQEPVAPREPNHLVEEAARHVSLNEALSQAREVGLIEPALLETHVHEPAVQQVVVELLAERSIRTDGVKRVELGIDPLQCRLGVRLDRPQRVIGGDARVRREIRKQVRRRIGRASHASGSCTDDRSMIAKPRRKITQRFASP